MNARQKQMLSKYKRMQRRVRMLENKLRELKREAGENQDADTRESSLERSEDIAWNETSGDGLGTAPGKGPGTAPGTGPGTVVERTES